MGNSEININNYELKDSNGNMRSLASNWAATHKVDEGIIRKSKGNVPDSIKDCINASGQVFDSFNNLLNNSIRFFEKAGLIFADADQTAAKAIKES